MKLVKHGLTRRDVLGGMSAAALLTVSGGRVLAQGKEEIKFATLMDFTKVYTFVSVEYNQGQRDYISMINATGGVDGYPLKLIVHDHASEPQRGIALYNEAREEGAVLVDFLSTPVSNPMVPRVLKDHIPMLTIAHGRGDAADGSSFPYVFPAMANYWSQAALIIQHIRDHDGGLKGKKIAHIYIDSGFGREPIPVFQALAEREGFEYQGFPYPSPGTEQSSTWSSVRRFKPDRVILWGAGPGQAVSVRGAITNGIPVENIYSVKWITDSDVEAVGAKESVGLKRYTGVNSGTDLPIIQRIMTEVIDKGAGSGEKSKVGSTYYNTGVASMAMAVEGARLALEKLGGPLTGEKLKQGLEMIKDFDAEGLMPPITLNENDHQGGGWGRITQWNGSEWEPVSDWGHAYQEEVIRPMVEASAEKYKAESGG